MKFVFFYSVALSLVGLFSCHVLELNELDNSVQSNFNSALIPLDDYYTIHQILNNFNNFYNKTIKVIEQMFGIFLYDDNIPILHSNEIIYPENLFAKKVERNVLKRTVRSNNEINNSIELQKLDHSIKPNVSVHIIENKTEESIVVNTIPIQTTLNESKHIIQNKTEENILVDTIPIQTTLNGSKHIIQNKTEESVLMETIPIQTTLNGSVHIIQNKTDPIVSTSDNYDFLKIFSLLTLGVALGLLFTIYQRQQSRIRRVCHQVGNICRNNEETPV